jgi:16S rRNA processing protein RimM
MTSNIRLGIVVAAHGLAGQLRLQSEIRDIKSFESVKQVFLINSSDPHRSFTLESLALTKNGLLISLQDCTNRQQAEALIGHTVIVDQNEVKPLDTEEWWAKDLIGLKVFTTSGNLVGTIIDVLSINGSMLEVERSPDGQNNSASDTTILIPFVKELVPVVDLVNKRIEITDLPGLI